jgi:hypothetical protein
MNSAQKHKILKGNVELKLSIDATSLSHGELLIIDPNK